MPVGSVRLDWDRFVDDAIALQSLQQLLKQRSAIATDMTVVEPFNLEWKGLVASIADRIGDLLSLYKNRKGNLSTINWGYKYETIMLSADFVMHATRSERDGGL